MNKVRQFCAANALTIAITATALAGDMGLPGAVQPPTLPQQSSSAGSGDMGLLGATADEAAGSETTFVDSIIDTALILVRSMMSLPLL